MPLTPRAYAALAALAGGLAVAASRALAAWPPGGARRWERSNHAGATVTLLEGPALVLATSTAALSGAAAGADPVPALLAGLGTGAAGVLDDLAGDGASKGLRGHLGALARGQLTTGTVKIAVLGASGVLAADRLRPPGARGAARVGQALVGGAVIAGSANLANLLDLRPGRALKVCLLAAGVLGIRADRAVPGALVLGAGAGLLPGDLAGRTMLGDAGANPAGALVGTALVAQTGTRGRLTALAVLTGLTLASERISFTAVIESTPGLRELDAWGRR